MLGMVKYVLVKFVDRARLVQLAFAGVGSSAAGAPTSTAFGVDDNDPVSPARITSAPGDGDAFPAFCGTHPMVVHMLQGALLPGRR